MDTVKSSDDYSTIMYGTHFPNRLFVGCLPAKATAAKLGNFFSSFGELLEAKIILDQYNNSRRFGFITYAFEEDARKVLGMRKNMRFMGKKINIGPAIKKQIQSTASHRKLQFVQMEKFGNQDNRYTYVITDPTQDQPIKIANTPPPSLFTVFNFSSPNRHLPMESPPSSPNPFTMLTIPSPPPSPLMFYQEPSFWFYPWL